MSDLNRIHNQYRAYLRGKQVRKSFLISEHLYPLNAKNKEQFEERAWEVSDLSVRIIEE